MLQILIIAKSNDPNTGYGKFTAELMKDLNSVEVFQVKCLTEERLVKSRKLGIFINPILIMFYGFDCAIIHALDGYPYGLWARIANVVLGKSLVITLQGTYSVEPLYTKWKRLMHWAYKGARLVAISRYTRAEVLKVFPDLEIGVIHHGVDLEKLALDAKLDITDPYILSVGTLTGRKRYHISIPAFAQVKKRFTKLKYLIIGDGYSKEYLQFLENLSVEHGVKADIIMWPKVSQEVLAEAFRRAQLFLLPAINVGHHFEGFGLVFLEGAAAGIPSIGTLGNGGEDAVLDGTTGILVEQGNVEQTANAMINLLEDEAYRKKMGRQAAESAASRTWTDAAFKYHCEYLSLRCLHGKKWCEYCC